MISSQILTLYNPSWLTKSRYGVFVVSSQYGLGLTHLTIPTMYQQISHNAPFCDRNVHMCEHFCNKMVHSGMWHWCIAGCVRWNFCCVMCLYRVIWFWMTAIWRDAIVYHTAPKIGRLYWCLLHAQLWNTLSTFNAFINTSCVKGVKWFFRVRPMLVDMSLSYTIYGIYLIYLPYCIISQLRAL